MATRTTTFPLDASTDANFRAFGSWISASFAAFGWTLEYQNFVTGSDWTSVTKPASANTTRVTEVWAMADSLQATAPYYLKLEYGMNSTTNPAVKITLATGHVGSGTMSGVLVDTSSTFMFATQNTNTMTHYASGDTNRIQFMIGVSGTSWVANNMWIVNVERRKDGSGNDTATGYLFNSWGSGNGRHNAGLAGSAHPTVVTGTVRCAAYAPSSSTDQIFDSKIQISPVLHVLGPMEMGLGLAAAPQSVYTTGGTFTCTILGTSHTYVASQGTTQMAGIGGTHLICMRYE